LTGADRAKLLSARFHYSLASLMVCRRYCVNARTHAPPNPQFPLQALQFPAVLCFNRDPMTTRLIRMARKHRKMESCMRHGAVSTRLNNDFLPQLARPVPELQPRQLLPPSWPLLLLLLKPKLQPPPPLLPSSLPPPPSLPLPLPGGHPVLHHPGAIVFLPMPGAHPDRINQPRRLARST